MALQFQHFQRLPIFTFEFGCVHINKRLQLENYDRYRKSAHAIAEQIDGFSASISSLYFKLWALLKGNNVAKAQNCISICALWECFFSSVGHKDTMNFVAKTSTSLYTPITSQFGQLWSIHLYWQLRANIYCSSVQGSIRNIVWIFLKFTYCKCILPP